MRKVLFEEISPRPVIDFDKSLRGPECWWERWGGGSHMHPSVGPQEDVCPWDSWHKEVL